MSTHIATEAPVAVTRRTWRARALTAVGPVTVAGGIVWALFQPYRLTFLHPHGQGFWWLVSEPPLFVVLVGLLFHALVLPGVLEDLERANEEGR